MDQGGASAGLTYLTPLGVGETLDAALALWRRNFKHFFLLNLAIMGPLVAINLITLWTTLAGFDAVGGRILTSDPQRFSQIANGLPILYLFGTALAFGAQFYACTAAYHGEMPSIGESIRSALRRILPFAALLAIYWVGVGVASILLFIPGIFVGVSYALAMPAFWGDPTSAISALGRSWRLVRGRRWPVLGVLVSLMIILTVFAYATVFALILLPLLTELRWVAFVGFAAAPLLGLLFAPIVPITLTVAYFDTRIRSEAFDLQLAIDRLPPVSYTTGESRA